MKALIQEVEIRGYEVKNSRAGQDYLVVRFEDDQGFCNDLIDRNVTNKKYYDKGNVVDLLIDIREGKNKEGGFFTSMEILGCMLKGKRG
jgi:hypothetical protein